MKTFIKLKKATRPERPEGFQRDAFPERLVELFLEEFTDTGDKVLDPFAGFGTTLLVCERMNRVPLGIEYLSERVQFIRERLKAKDAIIHGDSRHLNQLGLPPVDFSITSPPYMFKEDLEDPLQAYTVPGTGYADYLSGIRNIYLQLAGILEPGKYAVINVTNMKRGDQLTTLAWDIAGVISEVMRFEREIVVCWDDSDNWFGYDHEYCLIFSRS